MLENTNSGEITIKSDFNKQNINLQLNCHSDPESFRDRNDKVRVIDGFGRNKISEAHYKTQKIPLSGGIFIQMLVDH